MARLRIVLTWLPRALALSPSAYAQETRVEPSREAREQLPEAIRYRPRMSQADIDSKAEGGYVTGLPLLMFDSSKGFGVGARLYHYHNGDRSSPYFEYTPYRHRTFVQGLVTTGGWQYHMISYDGIAIANSPYRLRIQAAFERNTQAGYYGSGSASMGQLRWSGSGRTYATRTALDDDLRVIRADGTVGTAYNRFDLLRPMLNIGIERALLGGRLIVQVGAIMRYASITRYDGRLVKGDNPLTGATDVSAPQGPTLLSEDCAAGRIVGCNGGWENVARGSIAVDTRDFEPDPNFGIYIGVSAQVSSTAFGSEHPYGRVGITMRDFISPFPTWTDLVIATRIGYQLQSKDTPFFSMSMLTFPDTDEEGLGGLKSLRGYQQNRFIGPALSFASLELRWMPVKFRVARQHFGIGMVPFVDAGRVYDRLALNFHQWRVGTGVGLRVAWNQATIVVADYGVSSEDGTLAINFGHTF